MNDLYKKEVEINNKANRENPPESEEIRDGQQLKHDILGIRLLLLYQAYLNGETTLEPEFRMAIWRRARFDEEFPVKIRIAQMHHPEFGSDSFDFDGENALEDLFPEIGKQTKATPAKSRFELIQAYKEEVRDLLKVLY
ncbi:hypothetical protein [Poritiphilus flavus]|uniref:Uncharacterized protein n=1 Tax=Poritiphilus flavus TaxID=2697053 RepID=A0A6L9EDH7_9FLAO|nr:hypothetical protein [Poritiphilus flavus]NAS12409.1 hypothetical protein [Poritiphilus flavus]